RYRLRRGMSTGAIDSEYIPRVFQNLLCHCFSGEIFELGEFFYHFDDIRRFVQLAAIGRRGYVGRVGFGEDSIRRNHADNFVVTSCKRDRPAERERKSEIEELPRVFRGTGEEVD